MTLQPCDCFISAIPGSGLGNETFPFQLLPASFPDSHVADTGKCVLRLLKQNIFMFTHCIPAQTEVNLAQTTWQGPHGVSKHPGALAAGPAAGRLLLPRSSCSSSASALRLLRALRLLSRLLAFNRISSLLRRTLAPRFHSSLQIKSAFLQLSRRLSDMSGF